MIRIFVDDALCVADRSQSVKIDYRSTDLSDIESGREGTHIRLRLPSTLENDAIFCYPADVDAAYRFNEEHHIAYIESDEVEIFRGTAYLDGVEIEDGATWYKLEIIGGASLWAKLSASQMFNTIGVDYSATLDMDEICRSWQGDSPVKFLPISRYGRELSNGATSLYVPEKILTTDDYHPFLSVAAMVRAIFEDAGYRVESRFFESELFQSLYVSGAYSTTDIDARSKQMDFKAGRVDSVSAVANHAGRVYLSPLVAANSLGNIVDTTDEFLVDESGNEIPTGYYSKNGCFCLDDNGRIAFKPLTTVKVGFEYMLKMVCGYRMATRERLSSFDHFYFEDGITIPFVLTNRFEDCRNALQPNFEYRIVIFDYSEEYSYRLRCVVDGEELNLADVAAQTALVQTPADAVTIESIELLRAPQGSDDFEVCTEDWALYGGYVDFEGEIEVEMTLRTPAVEVTPTSPKLFDKIYIGGGEPGLSVTLLPGTTLRPNFTSTIGYGSQIEFADVAQIAVRQNVLLDAVRHMFDLRFYTDEREKRIYIEPYGDFVNMEDIFDWTSRIDLSQPILIEEQVRSVRQRRTLGYREGDEAVRRLNSADGSEMGEWQFKVDSWAAKQGNERLISPLFAPTVSASGCYANAESALVMQIGSVEDDSGGGNQTIPRIVRYVGMHPLPENERWGYPDGGNNYPLAAFHFAGDDNREGFTLCFEDRDDVQGLHTFYERRFAEEARCHRVTLSMRLSPADFDHLFHFVEGAASIRSLFELQINGVTAQYSLYAIENYDPAKSSVRCVFSQIPAAYE